MAIIETESDSLNIYITIGSFSAEKKFQWKVLTRIVRRVCA